MIHVRAYIESTFILIFCLLHENLFAQQNVENDIISSLISIEI